MPIRKVGTKWKIDNVSGRFDTRRDAVKALKDIHVKKRYKRKGGR